MERAQDICEFASRRWELSERLKAEFWVEEMARMSPREALQVAEGLRLQASALNPDWPTDLERDEDLESHATVARKLVLVGPRPGR